MAEHWCKEHKTQFFMKGKMKGFAHPITDVDGEPTGGWCNEAEKEEPKVEPKLVEIQPAPVEKSQLTSAEWAAKDKITRKSTERQTALNNAVACAKLLEENKVLVTSGKIISLAKKFELYLETGMDVEALASSKIKEGDSKTRLVEAVKAHGGIEQKGG